MDAVVAALRPMNPYAVASSESQVVHPPHKTVWSEPPKRPAGRTKLKETRHAVYRGVRRRGPAGR